MRETMESTIKVPHPRIFQIRTNSDAHHCGQVRWFGKCLHRGNRLGSFPQRSEGCHRSRIRFWDQSRRHESLLRRSVKHERRTTEDKRPIFAGKLLQNENQTLAQCKFNDYDLITCQRSRCACLRLHRASSLTASRLAADPVNPGASGAGRRHGNRTSFLLVATEDKSMDVSNPCSP